MTRTTLTLALVSAALLAQASPLSGQSKNFAPLVNHDGQGWTERYIDVPFLGQVNAYVPKTATTDVVLFLSGDDGWQLGVVDMARRIAPHHVIVVGLNFVAMRKGQGDVACWDTSAVLAEIAHATEDQLHVTPYRPPTLVGYSSG